MKKILTCAGLAAVGAVGLQAQYDAQPEKPWSVSARVRGFYDDNYATLPSSMKEESWGASINPALGYTLLRDLTTIGVKYEYDGRWYEARPRGEMDHTHIADLNLRHTFSERYKLDVDDNFVVGQEPYLLNPANSLGSSFIRTVGDNMRNTGSIAFTAGISERVSTRIGYVNSLYDYTEDGVNSRSAMLDRMEHLISADLRYQFQPTTTGLIGYQYGFTGYNSDDFLYDPASGIALPAEYRDSESHYLFLGVDHSFNSQLSALVRLGAQYTIFPNADVDDTLSPYADASMSYAYREGSTFSLGVKHGRNATDVALFTTGVANTTLDAESTTVYAAASHRFTPKFIGTLRGQWQGSSFNQGMANDEMDNFYAVDLNLSYEFMRHLWGEVGYAYDRLDSDIQNRGFDRNRVWVGVRATY